MKPEDVTAWATAITAFVAIVGVVVSVSGARGQRRSELMVSALTHFVGGSQQRSAGVAALSALRGRKGKGWRTYAPALSELFYLQLVYVLNVGSNRHEAHELGNIVQMCEWLLGDGSDLRQELVADRMKVRAVLSAIEAWEAGALEAVRESERGGGRTPPIEDPRLEDDAVGCPVTSKAHGR